MAYQRSRGFRARRIAVLGICLAGGMLPPIAFAEEPTAGTDAFLFYSRRADASGDASSALVQPSLFTGSATSNVPIVVPPGTGGMAPSLAFSYSSGRGRGNAGVGWSLELSKITRSTKYGADRAQTWSATDAIYLLDGDELVKSGTAAENDGLDCNAGNATRYYTKTDRFQKILFCEPLDYWVVFDKSGTKQTFGRRAVNSKFRPGTVTFEYYLDEVIEPHGLSWRAQYSAASPPRLDRVQYTFHNGSVLGETREVVVEWQTRTDWTRDFRYGAQMLHDARVAAVTVNVGARRIRRYVLSYDADPATTGEQLSLDSESSMLRSVQMFGTSDTIALPPMRFEYQSNVGADPGFDGVANSITAPSIVGAQQDGNGSILQDLVDLNGDGHLDWVHSNWSEADTKQDWTVQFGNGTGGFDAPAAWVSPKPNVPIRRVIDRTDPKLTAPDVQNELIDMNADGLPDLVLGHLTIHYNTGTAFGGQTAGSWTPPGFSVGNLRDFTKDTINQNTANAYTTTTTWSDLVDGNGDGCPDKFVVDGGQWHFFRNLGCDPGSAASGYAPEVIWTWPGTPPGALAQTEGMEDGYKSKTISGFVEVNGDGLTDYFNRGTFYYGTGRGFVAEPSGFFTTTWGTITGTSSDELGKLRKQGSWFGLADVNGDGRADVVETNPDHEYIDCAYVEPATCEVCEPSPVIPTWRVWLNKGRSFVTTPIAWDALKDNGEAFGFLQSSGATACPKDTNAPRYGTMRVLDFDANGTPDFINLGAVSTWYLRKNKGPKPELLRRIENGVGGLTELTYGAHVGSTAEGNLHFPVTVLTRSITSDTLAPVNSNGSRSSYTEDYTYRNAFFDRKDRAFRGFETAEVIRTDNMGSVASFTRHRFATGDSSKQRWLPIANTCIEPFADHPALAGRLYGTQSGEWVSGAAVIHHESWTKWAVLDENRVAPGSFPAVPVLERRRDLVPGNSAFKWNELTFTHDAYGNRTRTTNQGEVSYTGTCTTNYAFANDEVSTVTAYAVNTANWLMKPSEQRTCADEACSLGQVLSHQQILYDGLAFGQVSIGNPTTTSTWVHFTGPDGITDPPDTWADSTAVFDAYGNVISTSVELSELPTYAVSTITYGTASKAYPTRKETTVQEGKPVGGAVVIASDSTWDEGFGTALTETDANGRRLTRMLDGLGRLDVLKSTPPGDPLGAEITIAEVDY